MSDYDAIFAAAVGGSKPESADPYDEVFSAAASTLQRPQSDSAPQRPSKGGTGSAALDVGNAVGTGYWRGLARLAGLPADTAQNVIDLGKAAIGAPYIAVTGKAPPEWLQLGDRANVIGSGDNIIESARKTSAGRVMLDAANPEFQGGYLQNAGSGLTAVMNPNSAAQAVNQAALGVLGNTAGKVAYDATGNPALAVTASVIPMGAQQAATAATKYAVRGGEQERKVMEQRIQDLKNAGIENPTLGLASGNKMIGGVENILQSTPGAVGIMGRARDQALAGLQATTEDAAGLASPNRGTFEAGQAVQKGVNDTFKGRFKATQDRLYDRLEQEVGSQFPTDVQNTRQTLASLNEDIPGAPALSKFFKNGKIQALESALASDTAGAPASVQVYSRAPVAGGGLMNAPIAQAPVQVEIPAGPPRNTLPFEAVKKTRTMVGNEIADSTIVSDVPRSKWNPLYGALSEDMRAAANAVGGGASSAFERANNYTRAGMDRLDRIAPFGQTAAPEQAFTAMERAARENVSTLQAVKKSLPQDARGQVAGTIIDRLGRATNGQQNDTTTVWSPETFLTNWNKMTPRAREELFSGFKNAPEVKANVEAVAKAASMMRDSSKMWANPSGTGANTFARGMLGAVGVGGGASALGLLNPMVPVGIGIGLLGANRLAAGLTNPDVVAAMARRSYMTPELLNGQYRAMLSSGLLSQ